LLRKLRLSLFPIVVLSVVVRVVKAAKVAGVERVEKVEKAEQLGPVLVLLPVLPLVLPPVLLVLLLPVRPGTPLLPGMPQRPGMLLQLTVQRPVLQPMPLPQLTRLPQQLPRAETPKNQRRLTLKSSPLASLKMAIKLPQLAKSPP